jgi:hypothetical protein
MSDAPSAIRGVDQRPRFADPSSNPRAPPEEAGQLLVGR